MSGLLTTPLTMSGLLTAPLTMSGLLTAPLILSLSKDGLKGESPDKSRMVRQAHHERIGFL